MKTWLVCLLPILFYTAISAQSKRCPVKISSATQQNWVSGAPGGRTGTKYSIRVYIDTKQKVEFTNLWIGSQNVAFDVEFFSLDIPKKIQFGDSLLLVHNKLNNENNTKADAKRLPIHYKGFALIEAVVGGKARYFIVKKVTSLPDLRGR